MSVRNETHAHISQMDTSAAIGWVGQPLEYERGWGIHVNSAGDVHDAESSALLLKILREELRRQGIDDALLVREDAYDDFSHGDGKYLRRYGQSIEYGPFPSVRDLIRTIGQVIPERGLLLFALPAGGPTQSEVIEMLRPVTRTRDDGTPVYGRDLGVNGGRWPYAPISLAAENMRQVWEIIAGFEGDKAELTSQVHVMLDDRVVLTAPTPDALHRAYFSFRVWRGLPEEALLAFERLTVN